MAAVLNIEEFNQSLNDKRFFNGKYVITHHFPYEQPHFFEIRGYEVKVNCFYSS